MTSSARLRMIGETVKPSALAVLRLTASSILVGNSTGRSPGAAPRKILFDEVGCSVEALDQIDTITDQSTGCDMTIISEYGWQPPS